MEQVILVILSEVIGDLVLKYCKWEIQRKVDNIGNSFSQIVAVYDDDGDGVNDREEVVYSFDVSVPDLSDKFSIVNRDDEIGLGYPQLEIFPACDLPAFIEGTTITCNDNCILIDDDVYCPLPLDYDGDRLPDWGRVIDDDHNGVPDASPDAPFYPVGSDGYNQILETYRNNGGVDIVLVSSDGEIAIYDRNGNIKAEDVDTAYATWVSENGIMNKKLDNYSVTEGLLLLSLLVSVVFFIRSLFKRKDVFR